MHHFNETEYGSTMTRKYRQYEALICKAETLCRDNQQRPSKEEAICYRNALKVCEEICALNLSQSAEYNKWRLRADECEAHAKKIMLALTGTGNQSVSSPQPNIEQKLKPSDVGKKQKIEQEPKSLDVGKQQKVDGHRQITTVESGFSTQWAEPPELKAEMIEGWYQQQPKHDFSKVSGMKKFKEDLWKIVQNAELAEWLETIRLQSRNCLFFYGPPGTGKTFIIESFISELMSKKGYKYLKLGSSDIKSKYVGIGEKILRAAFGEAKDKAPCVIFIDEFDSVCPNRANPDAPKNARTLVNAFLEAYNMLEKSDHVIVMAATNFPNRIDAAVLDRLEAFFLPLPDMESKEAYTEQHLAKEIPFAEDLTTTYIVENLNNYSFRDMEKLFEGIKHEIISDCKNKLQEEGRIDSDTNPKQEAGMIDALLLERSVVLTKEAFDDAKSSYSLSPKAEAIKACEEFEKMLSEAKNN